MRLKTRFFLLVFLLLSLLGTASSVLGFFIIQTNVVERSKKELEQKITAFKIFYQNEIEEIKRSLALVSLGLASHPLEELKEAAGLDYLVLDRKDSPENNCFVKPARRGQPAGGTRLISQAELASLSEQLAKQAQLEIIPTPKAGPLKKTILEDALTIEYALPLAPTKPDTFEVLYGGKILNNNLDFIDRIHNFIFSHETYGGKPIGTVTLFLDDVRIATNVLTIDKKRAIGSRLSAEVYQSVFKEGQSWRDLAFVVTDWYWAAYEPLRDCTDQIIGVIYVGMLAQPFTDIIMRSLFFYLAILISIALGGLFITYLLVQGVSRPINVLVQFSKLIAAGAYSHRLNWKPKITEVAELSYSLQKMAEEIQKREKELHAKNEELTELNKSYLDLIGFVAHELKGILASTILNAYTVRDGFLGMINFKQRKALDSITRNLDYLAETVKNFLNLSRIEKGELELKLQTINVKNDLIANSLSNFEKLIADNGFQVEVDVNADLEIEGDRDLLLIVVHNLLSNALKYGQPGGKIRISCYEAAEGIVINFYNDGDPIKEEDAPKLFGKFVRLDDAKKRHIKGTGLGLFITKQIVEQHGGNISCHPQTGGNIFTIILPLRRLNA